MNKEKLKLFAPWLVAIVLGAALLGGVAKAASGFSWASVEAKLADLIFGKLSGSLEVAEEELIGASGTRFPNGLSADTTSPLVGQVRGSTVTITSTSTLGYTPNQLNTPQTAMNGNSTTLCAVQNTSGVNRIITGLTLASTGSTGDGLVTSWRGYVSVGRADNNTAATATLFRQMELPVTVTGLSVWGGPVPGSYFTSSTANQTGVSGISTTTPVLWRIGWFANVTSTAITSSTGNCSIHSYPL